MDGPVNLAAAFDTFSEQWAPRVAARYNDNDIRLVRVEGPFVWHRHPETDDFFLVLDGVLDIELRERTVTLRPGELFVVPQGLEHRPVARHGEVRMIVIEPTGNVNTGDPATATPVVPL
jgi:mannose-6-phosphate isomerase-like protein (cupin superfamily)